MKKLLFQFFLITTTINTYAQDSVSVKEGIIPEYTYCQIVGIQKFLSTKCVVNIDFGDGKPFKDNRIVNEKGEVMNFNSMVDALNYMGELGWEFVQAYVITMDMGLSKQNVYHYLLKHRITDADKATYTPLLKRNIKKE
ncbi:MAG: hypothetical protein ACK5UE_13105 [Chitinophagales bacterium]|jgi:hypothetical protein